MHRLLKDIVRSCERGQGAPRQALPLPMDRYADLPGGREPWSPGGPTSPRNAVVVGTWFLCREIELSCLRASFLGQDLVEERHLGGYLDAPGIQDRPCSSGRGTHPLVQLSRSAPTYGLPRPRRLGSAAISPSGASDVEARGSFVRDAPLFPNADGRVCTKEAMVATIRAAAGTLDTQAQSTDGSRAVTGHSLRVSGAQGLTRKGVDLWAVQLLGRWGSSAVQRYVAEVPPWKLLPDKPPKRRRQPT